MEVQGVNERLVRTEEVIGRMDAKLTEVVNGGVDEVRMNNWIENVQGDVLRRVQSSNEKVEEVRVEVMRRMDGMEFSVEGMGGRMAIFQQAVDAVEERVRDAQWKRGMEEVFQEKVDSLREMVATMQREMELWRTAVTPSGDRMDALQEAVEAMDDRRESGSC